MFFFSHPPSFVFHANADPLLQKTFNQTSASLLNIKKEGSTRFPPPLSNQQTTFQSETMSDDGYEQMRVVDLKELLTERGLDTSKGVKAELISRLREADLMSGAVFFNVQKRGGGRGFHSKPNASCFRRSHTHAHVHDSSLAR